MRHLTLHGKILVVGSASLFLTLVLLIGMGLRQVGRPELSEPMPEEAVFVNADEPPSPIFTTPVRTIPKQFKADTHLPNNGEGRTSGSRKPELFSAGRDLIYVDDERVFWESDNDTEDDECDHSMHKALEAPLRLLIELVHAEGGILEVQDTYRATGIHSSGSLHKEGRAIDLTCDEIGLERLAKLCWAAGFDWVYYEASSKGGAHVHCSVKRDHTQPQPQQQKESA